MVKVEKMVLKKIEFTRNNKSGFGLLELMLALALISVIGMIVVPNFLSRVPRHQRTQFIETLNAVVHEGWLHALETGHVQKVTFNLEKRTISLHEKIEQIDIDGTEIFKPIALLSVAPTYLWPEHFVVKQLFVQGIDEIAQHASGTIMEDIWFFIVPEGIAQEVIINMIDTKDTHFAIDGQEVSFVLNPLRVQFEEYEEFRTPAA